MRSLVCVGLVGLLIAGGAHAQQRQAKPAAKPSAVKPAARATPKPLPVFSFMGDDTETVTTRTKLNEATCAKTGDLLKCEDYGDPTLGGASLRWLSMSFNKGLLYGVSGGFYSNRFGTLLEAFTAKYGAPKITSEKWQSQGGATFDNAIATWKFKGGELELLSLGPDVETGVVRFTSSANEPAREPPKVDF